MPKPFHIPQYPPAAKFMLNLIAGVADRTDQLPVCPYGEGLDVSSLGALYYRYYIPGLPSLKNHVNVLCIDGAFGRIDVTLADWQTPLRLWTHPNGGCLLTAEITVSHLLKPR